MVLYIASSEHTWDTGLCRHALQATLRDDVAVFHRQVAFKYLGVGLVSDGDETPMHRQLAGAVVLGVFQSDTSHTRSIAKYLLQHAVQLQHDFSSLDLVHQFVDHDGFCFEFVTAMYQMHLAGNI